MKPLVVALHAAEENCTADELFDSYTRATLKVDVAGNILEMVYLRSVKETNNRNKRQACKAHMIMCMHSQLHFACISLRSNRKGVRGCH